MLQSEKMKEHHFVQCAFIAAVLFVFVSGCSQPLRTLMALGSEQQGQKDYVAKARRSFKVLLRDVRADRIEIGTASTVVKTRYGEPALERDGTFLYRDPVDFLHSSKVYLTFDADKKFIGARIEEKDAR